MGRIEWPCFRFRYKYMMKTTFNYCQLNINEIKFSLLLNEQNVSAFVSHLVFITEDFRLLFNNL
jgi:hypothetical protein